MTLAQRPHGGAGASHADTCGENVLGVGNSRASRLRLRKASRGAYAEQSGRAGEATGQDHGDTLVRQGLGPGARTRAATLRDAVRAGSGPTGDAERLAFP